MDDLDLGQTLRGFTAGQKVFERYTLVRLLGRGGMGVVWLARDEKLEQDVALKFLPELIAHDAAAVSDLKRETRRSLQLTHPHIVRIYDFVEDSRMAAVSMEFVDGASLTQRRLEAPGQVFTAEQLRPWVEQLCDALQYAHTKAKIAHRDLKPANLMADARGDLKVADFGISATLADTTTRASKQVGSSGTPVYMSPQQMMGEKPAPTDDVYSLGATLYELLTGKPPFYTGNVLLQVQNKVPPSLAARLAELDVKSAAAIPAAWEETIAACLAKQAEDRPQSAADVWRRLNGEAGMVKSESGSRLNGVGPDLASAPGSPVGPDRGRGRAAADKLAPDHTETPAKSNRPLAIGLAAVLAVAGIAGWYFGIHAPEQRRLEAEAIRLANARGGIVVQTEPAGAEISVGGVEIKQSPATFKELRLGSYEVKASKPGYEPETFQLKVEENRFADPGRVSLKPMVGTVAVATTPAGVNYTLTSKRLTLQELAPVRYDGHTPAKVEGLPIGEYRLTLHRDGWQDQESLVEVGRGKTANCNGDFSGGSLRIGMAAGQSDVGYRAIRDHALGRVVRTGAAPAQLDDLPPGNYSVTFERAGWSAVNQSVSVEPGKLAALEAAFASGNLEIASQPEGADFELSGGPVAKSPALAVLKQGEGRVAEKNGASVLVGKTPAKLDGLPVGRYTVTLRGANGWPAQMREVDVVTGGAGARVAGNFSPAKLIVESDPSGAEVWVGGKMLGKTPYTDPSIGPGKREVELRLAGYLVSRASGEAQPGAEVCLGGKLEPYLSAEIGDAAYEQNRAEALAALERGTADAKARAFVESDYWVRRAETLAASLSGKPQVDDTLSLLGFWAERGVASRVDQCGNFVLQRIGQMDEPSSLAGTLTTLNEQGYRDLCARFAAIAPETLKKEKNAVYSAGSLMEALWALGDKDGYAQAFALAQELVRKDSNPAIQAENLLETVWKLGDKDGYAQAFVLTQELTRKDSNPAIQAENLLETVWKLGDKDGYAQAFVLAQELTRKDSNPAIHVQNLLETVWKLGDKDGYAQAFVLAQELMLKDSSPAYEVRRLLETLWKLGDKVGYAQVLKLAPELVRKDEKAASSARDLMETLWQLGDKAGYAESFALAQELVSKDQESALNSELELLVTLYKLGDRVRFGEVFNNVNSMMRNGLDIASSVYPVEHWMTLAWNGGDRSGYSQAFAMAHELVRKHSLMLINTSGLLKILWELGDKTGYSQVYMLAQTQLRGAGPLGISGGTLLKCLWELGDKDGYTEVFALAQELVQKDSSPEHEGKWLMQAVIQLNDQDGGRKIQAWAEQLALGNETALRDLRQCLNETKRGEVAFASVASGSKKFGSTAQGTVAFGGTEYGSVVAASASFGTERFGSKPLGRAARYTALDKRVDGLVKVRDWVGLASLDFAGQNVGDIEVGWLEQKRFQALGEAGELARIASYVQQKKRAMDDPAKKNDGERINDIEFAFHVGDAELARWLIGRLEKKDENDYPDRILVAQLEKATWDGDLAAAERFLVSIKDATYRSSAASTLAKAYSRKGDRAAVERLIASFPEPEKQVSLMMSAAWIFD